MKTVEGYDGWLGSTLRKMPLWGDRDSEINFEWPTEEEWSLMDYNTSITSIDFASYDRDMTLSYVKLNYSDGQTKVFENFDLNQNRAYGYTNLETINFDDSKSRQIRAVCGNNHQYGMSGFYFLDSDDDLIHYYQPYGNRYHEKFDIAENEEIIGVYGN